MSLKCEKNFKEHLKTISDDMLINYYQEVELTHYPVLVLEEFQRRFKSKQKRDVLPKLKKQTKSLRTRGNEVRLIMMKRSKEAGQKIRNQSEKGFTMSMDTARKFIPNPVQNLELIERLGKLRDSGLISSSEFLQKKKELLKRI